MNTDQPFFSWNTGRQYAPEGQIIWAQCRFDIGHPNNDGDPDLDCYAVVFYDSTRGIDGFLWKPYADMAMDPIATLESEVMRIYDGPVDRKPNYPGDETYGLILQAQRELNEHATTQITGGDQPRDEDEVFFAHRPSTGEFVIEG